MLVRVFSITFSHRILEGSLHAGCLYEPGEICLMGATTGGKVFVHTPGKRALDNSGRKEETQLLNMNQTITAVGCGRLAQKLDATDLVFIGTPANVMAYDVAKNSTVFFKEVPDGANAICCGMLGGVDRPLAFVGGNCSIQGFDEEGEDAFWTITGDNVLSMALCDFDLDGRNELVVGSEDFDIRIFKEDAIFAELTETAPVTMLATTGMGRFAYGLANGTVGKYQERERYWRMKSSAKPTAFFVYDVDGDGEEELIVGWSSGRVEARNDTTGDLVLEDTFPDPIAGICVADLRGEGKPQVVVASVEGAVRGYHAEAARSAQSAVAQEQERVRELVTMKQTLETELKVREEAETVQQAVQSGTERYPVEAIPKETELSVSLAVESDAVQITIATTNRVPIRMVVVFGEGVFQGESHVIHPPLAQVSDRIIVPLQLTKDAAVDLYIKAYVGYPTGDTFHILEAKLPLPRFSMYRRVKAPGRPPTGKVSFLLKERVERITLWINRSFLLSQEIVNAGEPLDVTFQNLRDNSFLVIHMEPNGRMHLLMDTMDLASDLISSLASYLSLTDLQVHAHFSRQMTEFKETLQLFQDYRLSGQKLGADVAEHANTAKTLLIRAEDARLMDDISGTRKSYRELQALNRDLLTAYKIRCNNHQELMDKLKKINQFIQKAGSLRVGRHRNELLASCRDAIKGNNMELLFKTIQSGAVSGE